MEHSVDPVIIVGIIAVALITLITIAFIKMAKSQEYADEFDRIETAMRIEEGRKKMADEDK